MNWHLLYEKVIPYVVRIETQDGFGTGFLFGYNSLGTVAAIATAAHVVENANDWKQPIKLRHHQSNQEVFLGAEDRLIFLNNDRDSASILLAHDALPFPRETLPVMDPKQFKRVGVELAWTGFPSVAPSELCFFSGCVSAFLKSEDCYLIDGVAINGVSGGPVFAGFPDENYVEFVGSVSAYVANRVSGAALPGLLRAQDISHFHSALQTINSLDEERAKERDAATKGADHAHEAPPKS